MEIREPISASIYPRVIHNIYVNLLGALVFLRQRMSDSTINTFANYLDLISVLGQ